MIKAFANSYKQIESNEAKRRALRSASVNVR